MRASSRNSDDEIIRPPARQSSNPAVSKVRFHVSHALAAGVELLHLRDSAPNEGRLHRLVRKNLLVLIAYRDAIGLFKHFGQGVHGGILRQVVQPVATAIE